MAQRLELDIAPRSVMGKANKHLRKAGIIPANIYGHKEAPLSVQVEALAFERLRREHGTRNVLSLHLPNGPAQTALIGHVQRDARSGAILHVDFKRVSLRERVEVKIPLHFVGEAPGVKIQGGVLLPLLETLTVDCLASDLVEFIEVDISSLTDIDSTLRAGDIKLPKNFKLVTDPGEPVIKVSAPRVEAVPAATEAASTEEATPAPETETAE
jgi:large subunit ribosomal protein L25